MKPHICKMLLLAALLAAGFGCNSKEEGGSGVRTTVGIAISDNADNRATVSAAILTGEFVRAKVLECVPVDEITFDYNIEVKLVKFVEENGEEVQLPYTGQLQKLRPGTVYLSAVIAYNRQGRACCSDFVVWTAEGEPGLWSDDNSAGELEDNQW